MNWGDRIALLNVLLSLGASLGFFCATDWRRGTYFLLGAGITAWATWLL
jgi:hypothetical protein